MTTWIKRAQWGARDPHGLARRPVAVNQMWGVTSHYSTGQHLNKPEYQSDDWVRSIQQYHMNTLGYGDIAYNALFDQYGNIFEGRGNEWLGAHSKSEGGVANTYTFGLCFLGQDNPGRWDTTPAARDAMFEYLDVVHLVTGRKPLLVPHSYWKSTACPGDELRGLCQWWNSVVVGFNP